MLKIKHIKIQNFRSIVNLSLDVDRMNVFVGLNDAGKSNLLKALNLFFNGETEPGVSFDFETDYSKYAPIKTHKAKEIVITIIFEIPNRYSYHEDVEWKKVWRASGLHKDNSLEWVFTPHSKVSTLLKRIRYKYVPAVKSDNYFKLLLADLYMSIAKEANNELIEKAEAYSFALGGFTQEIGQRVQKIVGIRSNLIMPSNQVDIFKELVFITNDHSMKPIELSHRGDGIKAVHIPAILKYISEQDNRLMTNTSVPITTIWGYEEPENGIEMRKCFELARELLSFSNDVQEFITTHSPAFYHLGADGSAKVYYVYKDGYDFFSQIGEMTDELDIHERVGIMPIIAPIVAQKQQELDELQEQLNKVKFTDRDSIFVEGITDKVYWEMAINAFSPTLKDKINNGQLQIVTNEVGGCGTTLLTSWAIAWMHLNFKSKAVFLLDADSAGIKARKEIVDAKEKNTKSKSKLKAIMMEPTDEMKQVNASIHNSFEFTVEHLLSCDFWKEIIKRCWVEERSSSELYNIFEKVFDSESSLVSIIDKYVSGRLKNTIVKYKPRKEKKDKILNLAKKQVESGDCTILEGFRNTIIALENEFK